MQIDGVEAGRFFGDWRRSSDAPRKLRENEVVAQSAQPERKSISRYGNEPVFWLL